MRLVDIFLQLLFWNSEIVLLTLPANLLFNVLEFGLSKQRFHLGNLTRIASILQLIVLRIVFKVLDNFDAIKVFVNDSLIITLHASSLLTKSFMIWCIWSLKQVKCHRIFLVPSLIWWIYARSVIWAFNWILHIRSISFSWLIKFWLKNAFKRPWFGFLSRPKNRNVLLALISGQWRIFDISVITKDIDVCDVVTKCIIINRVRPMSLSCGFVEISVLFAYKCILHNVEFWFLNLYRNLWCIFIWFCNWNLVSWALFSCTIASALLAALLPWLKHHWWGHSIFCRHLEFQMQIIFTGIHIFVRLNLDAFACQRC